MRDQSIRFENSWILYLRSTDARVMLLEDLALLKMLEEKTMVRVPVK